MRSAASWPAGSSSTRSCARCLHSGVVVRADDEPPGLFVHGVVAGDRSAAAHAIVRLYTSLDAVPGPIRLPGLDVDGDYRVRVRGNFFEPPSRNRQVPFWWDAAVGDGFTVSGAVLTRVGLQLPVLQPAEGLLLHSSRP